MINHFSSSTTKSEVLFCCYSSDSAFKRSVHFHWYIYRTEKKNPIVSHVSFRSFSKLDSNLDCNQMCWFRECSAPEINSYNAKLIQISTVKPPNLTIYIFNRIIQNWFPSTRTADRSIFEFTLIVAAKFNKSHAFLCSKFIFLFIFCCCFIGFRFRFFSLRSVSLIYTNGPPWELFRWLKEDIMLFFIVMTCVN